MSLRLFLIAFFLLGIGIFSHAQSKGNSKENSKVKIQKSKPIVEDGPDAIPVTVTSTPRKKKPKSSEAVKFTPPVNKKDSEKKTAPPPRYEKQH
ncbi:MAG: hypothetical protein K2Q21_02220 [Chitinophagaceae bacterium]|nr:hypothetical protein [Chitinophagaceae bacterium]